MFFSYRGYEFEVKLPIQSILRVQIWDWDMTSSNDMIAETKIDIENRWFSCHRATCGLPKRYDRLIRTPPPTDHDRHSIENSHRP